VPATIGTWGDVGAAELFDAVPRINANPPLPARTTISRTASMTGFRRIV
jgi:hypothetical protein